MIKLVRDKIPEIISEQGKIPEFYVAQKEEYENRLLDKMVEELEEFREKPCTEEAADMFEVFLTICDHWDLSQSIVQKRANQKRADRGGFTERIIFTGVKDGNE